MYQSHASLRDDYEVSCQDWISVHLACPLRAFYARRMTGGGFGGCTINLVKTDVAETFKAHIAEAYRSNGHSSRDLHLRTCPGAQAWPNSVGTIHVKIQNCSRIRISHEQERTDLHF